MSTYEYLIEQLPLSWDIAVGRSAAPDIEKSLGGVLNNPKLTSYVAAVGNKLVPLSKTPSLPYQFRVINANNLNAFALPGGRVYITLGLLKAMKNEAQLAAVLGHEIGHAADRHGVKQLVAQLGSSIVLDAITGGRGESTQLAVEFTKKSFGAGYSREHESRADLLGVDNMKKAGYASKGAVQLMEVFKALGPEKKDTISAMLRSHPYTDDRIKRLMGLSSDKGDFGEARYRQYVFGESPLIRLAQGFLRPGVLVGVTVAFLGIAWYIGRKRG